MVSGDQHVGQGTRRGSAAHLCLHAADALLYEAFDLQRHILATHLASDLVLPRNALAVHHPDGVLSLSGPEKQVSVSLRYRSLITGYKRLQLLLFRFGVHRLTTLRFEEDPDHSSGSAPVCSAL